jgi:hypothetical protein
MKSACLRQVAEVELWLAMANLMLVIPESVARTLVRGSLQRWKK